MIVHLPAFFAFTTPFEDTVAMFFLLDFQVIFFVFFDETPFSFRVFLSPTLSVTLLLLMEMDDLASSVIVGSPTDNPVASMDPMASP